jgi:hypothetical protein
LPEERVLETLIRDVVVQHLRNRCLEEDVDQRLVVAHEVLELGPAGRLAHPRVPGTGPQLAAQGIEHLLVGPVAVLVAPRQAHGIKARLGRPVVEPLSKRAALVEGNPELGICYEHLEPAAAEIEL